MPRKNNDNNPLQMRLRVKSLPKYVTPAKLYQRLMQNIHDGRDIPESWDVEVWWRNPNTKRGDTKRWNHGDFQTVVSDSSDRGGFNTILYDALSRRLRRIR